MASVASADVLPDKPGQVETMPPVSEHWVWVPGIVFRKSSLFDGDSGELVAWIDSGMSNTPRAPQYSKERGEFYAVDTTYARGHHGERKDYVFAYDVQTMDIVGEIEIPPRAADTATGISLVGTLDGDRFLAILNQAPGTSVSVVDLAERKFVGEIQAQGCAGVFPAGPQRFGMLCGNGTAITVHLTPAGELDRIARSPQFFDVITDPVSEKGVRNGSRWLHASFGGNLYEIDYAGEAPVPAKPWALLSEVELEKNWRVGGGQYLAVHRPSGKLFSVVHRGGPGSHKDPGKEIWVWDLASKERIHRFSVPNLLVPFLQPQMEFESGGFVEWLMDVVLPNEGAHSIAVTQDEEPLLFVRHAELGAVGVLDATTGEHLRDLHEVGIAGYLLVVP